MSAAEKREREREKAARKAAKAGLKEENDVEEEEENDDGFFEEEEEFDGPDPRISQVCTPALPGKQCLSKSASEQYNKYACMKHLFRGSLCCPLCLQQCM